MSLALVLVASCFLPSAAHARTDWPIVVPAFRNDTGDAEWDWLAAGFPEALRTKLHGTIYMRAFTWEEIGHVLSQEPNLHGNFIEISKRLRSDLLLLGSYRKIGETIEVTGQCVDPVSGRELAAFKSMGGTHEPAEAVNELILQIAGALRVALPEEDVKRVRRPMTPVVDAFRAHALGLMALYGEERRPSAVADAERQFREAISLDPNFADPHYRLATLLQHRNDTAGAEKAYREALRADVDHRDARYRLGLMLIDLDRKSEAMTELEQALKQAPEDPAMQAALSSIWFDQYQSNFQQMADGLKQAIKADPDNAQLHVDLGGVYEELSKVREAASEYRLALSKDPKHADAAYRLGMIERNIGDPTRAAKLLRQAIANGTSEKRAHFHLGEMLTRTGDHAGAAAAFKAAVEAEPNHVAAYFQLGLAHQAAGNHQDALLAFGRFASIEKDDARPHLRIGQAYAAMGLPKQAKSAYEKSIQVDPNFADGHIAIGEFYEGQNLTFRAAKAFKDAIRVQPDHPRAEELKELIRKYQPAPAGATRQ